MSNFTHVYLYMTASSASTAAAVAVAIAHHAPPPPSWLIALEAHVWPELRSLVLSLSKSPGTFTVSWLLVKWWSGGVVGLRDCHMN